MKLKLVVNNAVAVPKVANGALPPSGLQFLRVTLNKSLPFKEARDWAEVGLPVFGAVVPGEGPGTFYLSRFTMPLDTIAEQFTLWQEEGVMTWEYA